MRITLTFLFTLFYFSITHGIWTQVRFFHGVPGFDITIHAPPLDDFELKYGEISQPKNVTSENGLYYWKIFRSDNPNSIISEVPVGMPLPLNYIWTTYYYSQQVLIKPIYENLEIPPIGWINGRAMVRFVHLASTIPSIRISQQDIEMLPNLMFPIDSAYIPLTGNRLALSTNRWAHDYHLGDLKPNGMYTMFFTSVNLNSPNPSSYSNLRVLFLMDRIASFGNNTENSNSTFPETKDITKNSSSILAISVGLFLQMTFMFVMFL